MSHSRFFDLRAAEYPIATPTPSPGPPSPSSADGASAPRPHSTGPVSVSGHRTHPQAAYRTMLAHPSDRAATPSLPSPPTRPDSSGSDSPAERDNKRIARDLLEKRNEVGPKLVIFMVGLPARGKSYICQKLKRYLSWMGFRTKVFNVGSRRRQVAKEEIATAEILEQVEEVLKEQDERRSVANGEPAAGLPPPADPAYATVDEPESEISFEPLNLDGGRRPSAADSHRSSGPISPGSRRASVATSEGAVSSKSGKTPVRSRTKSGASIAVRHGTDNSAHLTAHHDASFFDPKNQEANRKREEIAMETLEEILEWLNNGNGKVAIHDATNTTLSRRRALVERVRQEANVRYMFVESVCSDPEILAQNVKMKLQSPDYVGMPEDQAIADFTARMANYEKAYEAIGEREEKEGISYIKIENVGKKVTSFNVSGYLAAQCVLYLINMHIKSRFIYLTRHGESQFNVEGRVGGDPPLTAAGRQYAAALSRFFLKNHPPRDVPIHDELPGDEGANVVHIWTSRLKRTMETAEFLDDGYDVTPMRLLNEIYSGICEGMTYDEIQKVYPSEFKLRQSNKLIGRFPGGESYLDVIERLRPIIVELERMSQSVLIITHNVIMRTLLAYFTGMDLVEMTNLDVPLHTLYRLEPKPYGVVLQKFRYDPTVDELVPEDSGPSVVSNRPAGYEAAKVP
ncbi:6-phosphofructo-2-kinase [Hyaloraphidium curvatum]|nr:6-phosphofructo-2-kinase [Hyaloraphidium curvatum]